MEYLSGAQQQKNDLGEPIKFQILGLCQPGLYHSLKVTSDNPSYLGKTNSFLISETPWLLTKNVPRDYVNISCALLPRQKLITFSGYFTQNSVASANYTKI